MGKRDASQVERASGCKLVGDNAKAVDRKEGETLSRLPPAQASQVWRRLRGDQLTQDQWVQDCERPQQPQILKVKENRYTGVSCQLWLRTGYVHPTAASLFLQLALCLLRQEKEHLSQLMREQKASALQSSMLANEASASCSPPSRPGLLLSSADTLSATLPSAEEVLPSSPCWSWQTPYCGPGAP